MKRSASLFTLIGSLLIIFGLIILGFTFFPIIKEEITYIFNKPQTDITVAKKGENVTSGKVINPQDEEFGIVIPKIGANAKVVADVDPYNESIYQEALTRGVAHAKGSSLPDEFGNTFIFSHSSVNFYEATRYNSVFYLLSKLQKDDEIYIFYKGEKYFYKVVDKKTVDPTRVSYLENHPGAKTLTLMTCWPAGTTLKRLLVIAQATN